MKRTMCPVPRKWRAMSSIESSFSAALDDDVDLDRQPRRRSGVDAVEHARDREVHVVHRAEDLVVERVEADGDAA